MAPSRTISLKLVPVYLLVFHLVSLMLIGVNITRDQNRGDAFYGQNQAPSAALTLLLNYENHWGWSGDPYDIDYGSDMWVNETVIYLVGHNTTATKGTQFVIGKFTHDGSEIWNASWGGFVSGSDEAQAVWADSTGVYVTGFTYSYGAGGEDLAIVKWDHAGNKLWNSTWGGSDTEAGWDITGDGAGGIYTAGSTSTYGPFPGTQNALVVKWDATNGNEIWNATWGDALDDYATGIWANTSVIYTCGTTQSFGAGSNDACLVKWSSSNGARFWNYTWGGISSDRANDLVLANNSLFTAGSTSSFGEGSSDVAVVRWSLDGAVLWNRTQGTPESEEATAIATDPAENAIYMTGDLYENTYYYLTLIKFGVNGNLLHNETWPGYFSDNNGFGEAIAANGSTIFVAGASDSFGASYDFEFALLRYDGDEYQSDPPFISHVPDAPVLITPSQTIETDSITIQWHAVIGSNWYYLYVNGERTQILSGDDIEVVLRFLTSGTYKIWLTAVNASGESLPSNIITIQVDLPKFDFNLILLIFILCAAAVIIFGSLWSIRKKSREQPEKDEKFEDLFY